MPPADHGSVTQGQAIVQETCNGSVAQQWTVTTVSSTKVHLVNRSSRLCLDARGGATNGSQFFLVFKDTALSPSYTPFGTITSGLDILQKVANAGTSCTFSAGGGVPKEKVVLNSVTIKQS